MVFRDGILIWNKRLIPKTKEQNRGLLFIMLPFFLGMFISIFEALQMDMWINPLFMAGMIVLICGCIIRITGLVSIGRAFPSRWKEAKGRHSGKMASTSISAIIIPGIDPSINRIRADALLEMGVDCGAILTMRGAIQNQT